MYGGFPSLVCLGGVLLIVSDSVVSLTLCCSSPADVLASRTSRWRSSSPAWTTSVDIRPSASNRMIGAGPLEMLALRLAVGVGELTINCGGCNKPTAIYGFRPRQGNELCDCYCLSVCLSICLFLSQITREKLLDGFGSDFMGRQAIGQPHP